MVRLINGVCYELCKRLIERFFTFLAYKIEPHYSIQICYATNKSFYYIKAENDKLIPLMHSICKRSSLLRICTHKWQANCLDAFSATFLRVIQDKLHCFRGNLGEGGDIQSVGFLLLSFVGLFRHPR